MNLRTLVVCLFLAVPAWAELFAGSVTSNQGFAFLGKFCIDKDKVSTVDVELQMSGGGIQPPQPAPGAYPAQGQPGHGLEVLLYDDQEFSWPLVNGDEPCPQKRTKAKAARPVFFPSVGGKYTTRIRMTGHARPRFWYVAVSNCQGFKDLKYSVHFSNPESGSWSEEFGVNDQGVNSLYVFYFFVYCIFVPIHFYGIYQTVYSEETGTIDGKKVHRILELFSTILALQFVSVMLKFLHYSAFTANGFGLQSFNKFSDLLEAIARVAFVLLLMLLAKGWTITSDTLTGRSVILTTCATFLIFHVLILVWKNAVIDPSLDYIPPWSGLWFFENFLSAAWIAFAVWFGKTVHESYTSSENYKEEKRELFYKLGMVFTPWFLTRPVANILVLLLDPWVQDKIVLSLDLTVTSLAMMILVYLFWPSRASQYFEINKPSKSHEAYEDL